MMEQKLKQISEYKIKKVEEIKDILTNYPVIGFAHISQIGSKMLQEIRKNLRGKIGIKIVKNNLLKIALDEVQRENVSKLKDYLEGSTALVYTKENPFKLKLEIEKNRSMAPAKSGTIAPIDILIEKGDTGFSPGPVITELNEVGLKTRIKGGTVWIQEDAIVVKKGEVISPMLAIVLSRLDIRPIELGLDLYTAYDGEIYTKEDLNIDFEGIVNNISTAIRCGHNLAVQIGYATPDTIIPIIQKAYSQASSLVIQAGIIIKDFINEILAIANVKAINIAKEIIKINPDALPKELVDSLSKSSSEISSKEVSEKDSTKKDETSPGLGGLFGDSEPEKEKDDESSINLGNMFG